MVVLVHNLNYELKNCVKGCYTKCKTYKELAEYAKHLAYEFIGAADYMDTSNDLIDED